MFKTHGFYDLCIQENFFDKENIESLINLLYQYGYRTIAINQLIDDGNIEPKKKKKKGEVRETLEVVPVPYNVEKIQDIAYQMGIENFKVLTRLTISFAGQDVIHKITKSPNFKKYDIIASLPTTTQALSFTCATMEADIVTFNPENKFSLRLNRKVYNQLVEKGCHLELLYSPAIEDSTKRKNLIHMAHLFHAFGKSRNIIFSSGAEHFLHIRSPYDIVNLGFIFGLSELKCKCAVNEFPRKVIINSVGRRHGKAVMFVENLGDDNIKEDAPMEETESTSEQEEVQSTFEQEEIQSTSEQEKMDTADEPKVKRPKV